MADQFTSRKIYIQGIVLLVGMVLVGNAFYLQVLSNDFKQQADGVAIEKYTLYPSRGLIYDRKGALLVSNRPMYDLLVTYNQLDPKMESKSMLIWNQKTN